jgi:hypothetical protein
MPVSFANIGTLALLGGSSLTTMLFLNSSE